MSKYWMFQTQKIMFHFDYGFFSLFNVHTAIMYTFHKFELYCRFTHHFGIANNKQKSGFRQYLNMQITYPMKWPDILYIVL